MSLHELGDEKASSFPASFLYSSRSNDQHSSEHLDLDVPLGIYVWDAEDSFGRGIQVWDISAHRWLLKLWVEEVIREKAQKGKTLT